MPGRNYERKIHTAERDASAARLRAEGKTYERVASELGYADKSHARQAVQRALVATVQEAGDELRALEVERLNALLDRAWQVMDRLHYAHSQGHVVKLDGVPLVDDGPTLMAMDRILKVMERRAKLLGLDAPTSIRVMPSISDLDAEIERLSAEHDRLASRSATGTAGEAPGADG